MESSATEEKRKKTTEETRRGFRSLLEGADSLLLNYPPHVQAFIKFLQNLFDEDPVLARLILDGEVYVKDLPNFWDANRENQKTKPDLVKNAERRHVKLVARRNAISIQRTLSISSEAS